MGSILTAFDIIPSSTYQTIMSRPKLSLRGKLIKLRSQVVPKFCRSGKSSRRRSGAENCKENLGTPTRNTGPTRQPSLSGHRLRTPSRYGPAGGTPMKRGKKFSTCRCTRASLRGRLPRPRIYDSRQREVQLQRHFLEVSHRRNQAWNLLWDT